MVIKFVDDNLVGQNGLSRYIDPHSGWNRDVDNPDVVIYTDQKCFNDLHDSNNNYAWIIEPPIINGENYLYIVRDHKKFKKVFSYNTDLVAKIENFVFIPHGGTWLREIDISVFHKNKLVSCIFSNKQWNHYHQIRHRIYDKFKSMNFVDFYGSGSDRPIEYKIEGLQDYMFSIVVENSIENDYFTEKILDCFLTGTIPIYCGTKNIEKYFDTDGIITFDGDKDLPNIIAAINIDLYNQKMPAIIDNHERAKKYMHPELLINEHIAQ